MTLIERCTLITTLIMCIFILWIAGGGCTFSGSPDQQQAEDIGQASFHFMVNCQQTVSSTPADSGMMDGGVK